MLKLANFSSFKSLTDFLCPNVCNNQGLDSTVLALDLLVQSIPIKLENTIVLSYVVLYITVVQYDPTKHLLYDVKEEEYRKEEACNYFSLGQENCLQSQKVPWGI